MPGQLYRYGFLLVLAALSFTQWSAAQATSSPTSRKIPSLETILTRLRTAADQNRSRWERYHLLREYQMFHENNPKPMAEVKAELSYSPDGKNGYQILESKGNDRGSKVVSKLLESEASGWSKCNRPHAPTAISRDNYDFSFLGTEILDGHTTYVLGLHPLRKDTGLIDGKAWVDTETFLVRKIEGQEAKAPSWWVRNVALTLTFGPVAGMWLQTSSNAVADIRIVGKYTMVSHAVGVDTAEVAESNGFRSRD